MNHSASPEESEIGIKRKHLMDYGILKIVSRAQTLDCSQNMNFKSKLELVWAEREDFRRDLFHSRFLSHFAEKKY